MAEKEDTGRSAGCVNEIEKNGVREIAVGPYTIEDVTKNVRLIALFQSLMIIK